MLWLRHQKAGGTSFTPTVQGKEQGLAIANFCAAPCTNPSLQEL